MADSRRGQTFWTSRINNSGCVEKQRPFRRVVRRIAPSPPKRASLLEKITSTARSLVDHRGMVSPPFRLTTTMHISPAATSRVGDAPPCSRRARRPASSRGRRGRRIAAFLAPQPQRLAVERAGLRVDARRRFLPVELGGVERRLRLRVGDALDARLVAERREALELLAPALGHEPAEFLVVIGEIEERRRGRPFLALENQRRVRREAQQRARRPVRLRAARGREPFAERPVADLIVVGDAITERVRRQLRASASRAACRRSAWLARDSASRWPACRRVPRPSR